MSKQMASLRKNGFLGYKDLGSMLVDVTGVTGIERLQRQGVDKLGQCFAFGFTRAEVCDELGVSHRTMWNYVSNLERDDAEYLEACEVLMAEDLQKKLLRELAGKISLEDGDDWRRNLAKLDLIKGSAEHMKIMNSMIQKILDRAHSKKADKATGVTNNTQIIISDPSWIPNLPNAISVD